MSTLQVLDSGDPGVALRIARAVSGRINRKQDQPDIALVAASPPLEAVEEPNSVRAVRSPERRFIDLGYDDECRRTLGPLLDELLAQFEAAGWNRNKVAFEMMHLASKRISVSK